MLNVTDRKLFTPVNNPDNDIVFYVLNRRVAPLQAGFYFVNDSMSADARYLWFYCAFPPSLTRTLGVVDFLTGDVRHFPETQFVTASPFIDPITACAYWSMGNGLWRRGPQPDDDVELVNKIPDEYIGQRTVTKLATHLTLTPDRQAFFVDAAFGLQYLFGTLPVNGGDFVPWWRFDRNYNHAQVCPTDPDLVLFAEEGHADPITGLKFPITDRLWLIRRGEKPRPLMPQPTRVTHEWWDPDGQHVWCVSGKATWRINIADSVVETIDFPRHCWHSHSSANGRLLVGDSTERFYRGCASAVHFLNRDTGRCLLIANNPERADYAGANYHIDPHPRFCCHDQFVVFTTTVLGNVDVAVVPVKNLLDRT